MAITWFTGRIASGKSTRAKEALGPGVVWLDGDAVRKLWPELGFSYWDRWDNNERIATLAVLLESQGFDVVVSTICPYRALREEVQRITGCSFVYVEGGKELDWGPPYEDPDGEVAGDEEVGNDGIAADTRLPRDPAQS